MRHCCLRWRRGRIRRRQTAPVPAARRHRRDHRPSAEMGILYHDQITIVHVRRIFGLRSRGGVVCLEYRRCSSKAFLTKLLVIWGRNSEEIANPRDRHRAQPRSSNILLREALMSSLGDKSAFLGRRGHQAKSALMASVSSGLVSSPATKRSNNIRASAATGSPSRPTLAIP